MHTKRSLSLPGLTQSWDVHLHIGDHNVFLRPCMLMLHPVVCRLHPAVQYQGHCKLAKVSPVLYQTWSGSGKMQQKHSLVVQTQMRQPNVAICRGIPLEISLPVACYKICHQLAETLQAPPPTSSTMQLPGSTASMQPGSKATIQLQHDYQQALH